MTCPVCGRPLSLIGEVLAATEAGAQCHGCWKLLRRMEPAARSAEVTVFKPARRVPASPGRLRRAA